jgi:hypothetical protein
MIRSMRARLLMPFLAGWLVACQPVSAQQEVRPMTNPQSPLQAVPLPPESLGGGWRSTGEHEPCAFVFTMRTGAHGKAIEPMGACADAVLKSAREWRVEGSRVELLSAAGEVIAAYILDGPDSLRKVAGAGAPALRRAPVY